MKLQAEVSLYPLRTEKLGPPIRDFADALKQAGLTVRTGAMSTSVAGESEAVFGGLRAAFDAVAGGHSVVLLVKASNACPQGEADQADAIAKVRE